MESDVADLNKFHDFLQHIISSDALASIQQEIASSILVLLLTLALYSIGRFLRRPFSSRKPSTERYSEKLSRLTASLASASEEVDILLGELASVAKSRSDAVEALENEIKRLGEHEQQLQKKVQDLQAVPIPVADHFAEMMTQRDKRAASRDYVLFGLGVLVSTIIAIVLKIAGLG